MIQPSPFAKPRRWLSAYDPGVPESIEYPVVPIYRPLMDVASRHPGKIALLDRGEPVTYRELVARTEALAAALARLGAGKGDHVGIYLPNCPEIVVSYYGVMRAGAYAVMLSPALVEKELAHTIADTGFKTLICHEDFLPGVRGLPAESGLENVIVVADAPPEAADASGPAVHHFDRLLVGCGSPPPEPDIDPLEDVAVLIYTGGTTGLPKAVMLTHYAVVANAIQLGAWVEYGVGDAVLAALPLFHSYGMSAGINAPLFKGATSVLLRGEGPGELVGSIESARPKVLVGVPSTIAALIEHPEIDDADISSLEYCFIGSAPLPKDVRARFEEIAGASILEGYGLTEAVTAQSANPAHGVNKPGSIGIPFPDAEFMVVDLETGASELLPEKAGELIVRGPCLMKGYHNRPEDTAAALRDGWLYTGDIAWMDYDGYFFVIDRMKDLVIAGAFKAYPAEVEAVLRAHPRIKEAAVAGLFDDFRGHSLKAFVVLEESAGLTEEEVLSFCRENLSGHKVPRAVEFRDELPKSVMGKILRKELE